MRCSSADRAQDKAAASALWGSAKEAEKDAGEEESQEWHQGAALSRMKGWPSADGC